jgi:hypothetical protein
LDVGGVNLDREQAAVRVSQGEAVSATGSSERLNTLAAADLLADVIAFKAPF